MAGICEETTSLMPGDNASNEKRLRSNLLWLVFNQAVALADGILLGALVARYLGPERLGYLSYGLSIVAICLPCVQLGLDGIIVRNLILRPEHRSDDFWSAVALRGAASILAFFAMLLALSAGVFSHQNAIEYRMLAISFALILTEPLATVRLLLEAEIASYLTVWVTTLWRLVFAGIRIAMVLALCSPESFVIAHVLLALASSVTLFVIVRLRRLLPKFQLPKLKHLLDLLSESWPLAVSALAVAMYMNIDITMLMMMHGPIEAGVYSVAVQMSSVFYFLPMALYSTFFPVMARVFPKGDGAFEKQYAKYVELNVLVAYGAIALGWIAFPILIRLFFGLQYEASVQPFQIHIFGLLFVFLGVSRSVYLNLHGLHTFSMFSTLAGAATNIGLNFLLIPEYRCNGAAAATIVSHGVAAILTSFCCAKTIQVGFQQVTSALLLYQLLRLIRRASPS